MRQGRRAAILPVMTPQSQLKPKEPVVVVVDDDPAVCGSLKFSLELEGFSVRTFRNGAELLREGDLHDCQCFVIDQRMPGMSGMDLIASLRERNVGTPAILVISQPSDALAGRAAEAAVPIVEKPFLSNMLVERIREACRLDPVAGRFSHDAAVRHIWPNIARGFWAFRYKQSLLCCRSTLTRRKRVFRCFGLRFRSRPC